MPSYVVFYRDPSSNPAWKELSKIGHAQDDNDAWDQARWGVRGLTLEVLIKKAGFWTAALGKYERPSSSARGKPPYTVEEREKIEGAGRMSREYALQVIKDLNGAG